MFSGEIELPCVDIGLTCTTTVTLRALRHTFTPPFLVRRFERLFVWGDLVQDYIDHTLISGGHTTALSLLSFSEEE